jgi:hypothetical protein
MIGSYDIIASVKAKRGLDHIPVFQGANVLRKKKFLNVFLREEAGGHHV